MPCGYRETTVPAAPNLDGTLPETGGTSDNTVTAAIGILAAGAFFALAARRKAVH